MTKQEAPAQYPVNSRFRYPDGMGAVVREIIWNDPGGYATVRLRCDDGTVSFLHSNDAKEVLTPEPKD